ncbi:MAG: thioesterase [Gammaproteobacteria bacterium]|nr:thioesterase [Gammaproteobacteria bacterium]
MAACILLVAGRFFMDARVSHSVPSKESRNTGAPHVNPDSSGRHPPAWPPGPHECGVDPAWIDYNGHLRDGYFAVIASASIDALMDDLGIDESYRRATHCTLYTLELHLRFLREIKGGERLRIDWYPAEFDAKRLRLLLAMRPAGTGEIAAVVDVMLIHVRQDATVRSAPFPPAVQQRIADWHALGVPGEVLELGSRPLTLRRPP